MNAKRSILRLDTVSIVIPAVRIGYFNAKHAARLAAEIARDGQHDPIHVQSNGDGAWTLVAGLHRLRALKLIGRVQIDAIQVADSSATADDLTRLELSENLDHQHRRPIERAIFTVRLARIEEARDHPEHVGESSQARALRIRHSTGDTMSPVGGWLQRTAAAMDCSIRQLQRYQRIHRNIVESLPDLAERINFHPLGSSFAAVNAIASRDHLIARQKIAETLLERDDWQSMDAVLAAAGIKLSTGARDERLGSKAMAAFQKMSLHQKQAHVDWLADVMTPSMADRIVARLRSNGLLA